MPIGSIYTEVKIQCIAVAFTFAPHSPLTHRNTVVSKSLCSAYPPGAVDGDDNGSSVVLRLLKPLCFQ